MKSEYLRQKISDILLDELEEEEFVRVHDIVVADEPDPERYKWLMLKSIETVELHYAEVENKKKYDRIMKKVQKLSDYLPYSIPASMWDEDIVMSIAEQLDRRGEISDRQEEVLISMIHRSKK